jgi:hypothetical protein
VNIKQTISPGLFRLNNTFQILSIILTCLIATSFAGKVVADEVGRDEKGASSQTSYLAQTNDYPDLRLNKDIFKRYLENPYPVRRVIFDIPVGHPTKYFTNILIFEGSLLADTFFLHSQDSSVLTQKSRKNFSSGEISGKSSIGTYWFINGKASHGKGGDVNITSTTYLDPSSQTEAKFRSLESLGQLRGACWFGFRLMVPHSIVWSGDGFDILWYSSQWPHDTNAYTVHGEVLAYTNNLPLIIRLKSTGWPTTYKWVDFNYEYDFSKTDRFYPVNIWANLVLSGNLQVQGMTFQIPNIEFGDADASLPESGYDVAQFMPSNVTVPAYTFISSNQNIYWVNGGQLLKIEPPIGRVSLISSRLIVRTILFVLLFLPAVIFCAAVMKKRIRKIK